uniref:hypothetical protein n=1 Tax=Roseivirga sp. TaxID=1964215 RepID=UPI0040475620
MKERINLQTRAFLIYAKNGTKEAVVSMLKEQDYSDDDAESLSVEYFILFHQMRKEKIKKLKSSIETDRFIGWSSLVVGFGGTITTYMLLENQYFLLWGAIAAGCFYLGKSYMSKKEVERLLEKESQI